jgi:hypothetical protein
MRSWLLLLCLGLCACSSVAVPPEPTPPDALTLSNGTRAAINDSHFAPPIEVTDLVKAPSSSSDPWMVCIRGTPPAGPAGWTYSAFFSQTAYVKSRYSADADGCAAQQYHPFVEVAPPSPSPSPTSEPKKHGKRHQ